MFLVLESNNEKIGYASATYAPIKQTCSPACPLMGNGCYAQSGNVLFTVNRLERQSEGLNGDTLAMLEGAEIRDRAPKDLRPLRIHVSGDATTEFRARAIAQGALAWLGKVWSYTHAWRDVPREAWGRVSILASCESIADAKLAHERGYAAALVVPPHKSAKAYELDGMKVIPCPSQTRDVKCTDCRLCFDADGLHSRRSVIAFEVHGASKKRALHVIQN